MIWIKFSLPGQFPADGEHSTPPWDRRGPSPEEKIGQAPQADNRSKKA